MLEVRGHTGAAALGFFDLVFSIYSWALVYGVIRWGPRKLVKIKVETHSRSRGGGLEPEEAAALIAAGAAYLRARQQPEAAPVAGEQGPVIIYGQPPEGPAGYLGPGSPPDASGGGGGDNPLRLGPGGASLYLPPPGGETPPPEVSEGEEPNLGERAQDLGLGVAETVPFTHIPGEGRTQRDLEMATVVAGVASGNPGLAALAPAVGQLGVPIDNAADKAMGKSETPQRRAVEDIPSQDGSFVLFRKGELLPEGGEADV